MPRTLRLVNKGEKTCYHVMSRTALDGYPFRDVEKDELVKIIKRFSKLFFVKVFGYCVMGNHFHLLIEVFPEDKYTDKEIKRRLKAHYGKDRHIPNEQMEYYRKKLSSLANYMKEIKQAFSWHYNKKHDRRGTLWGERFKSVIVENGETLINCLAYIDLNPVRARLVKRPEDYRWCSLAYHMQTDNKDGFLSFDFGLKEFGVRSKSERLRRYRRYVYDAGAMDMPEKKRTRVINKRVIERERKKDFMVTRMDRFVLKTRYFSDSGIIGSKEFVSRQYETFKNLFVSQKEKKPKPITGLDGLYSLKRLSEV
jgi:putative transposase